MLYTILLVLFLHTAQSTKNYSVITWNMQGAFCSGEPVSKWLQIRQLIGDGAEIVALQEAGSPNAIPSQDQITPFYIDNPDNVPENLTCYRWDIGTSTRVRTAYIYFLNLDTRGHRVNLAFVSVDEADEVVLLRQSVTTLGRPALGIIIGSSIFFNIHAISSTRGHDAPALINRIYQYTVDEDISSWMILGDFNQNSTTLESRIASEYSLINSSVMAVAQDQPTHYRGGNLDFAVVPRTQQTIFPTIIIPTDLTAYSDHIPVAFPSCGH